MLILKRATTRNSDFENLIMELDINLIELYNKVQYEYDKYAKVDYLETAIIAYMEDIAVGCSCFKEIDKDTIEIKRTFVNPYLRGSGIAGGIITELTNWAKELNYTWAVLEIGIKQVEAVRMYTKSGFQKVDNFGPYIGSTVSVCMGKTL